MSNPITEYMAMRPGTTLLRNVGRIADALERIAACLENLHDYEECEEQTTLTKEKTFSGGAK